MASIEIIVLIILGGVCYLAIAEALKSCSFFGTPRILAALVTILGIIGLKGTAPGLLEGLLIPYATLLLAVAAVWLGMKLFSHNSEIKKRKRRG
jgi:hypothetical protein